MVVADVLVPLLNANEPEARLVGIHVEDGQPVKQGDILFSLETTKATADIESPASGFVRLRAIREDIVTVGEILAVITETKDDVIDKISENRKQSNIAALRITQPARSLASQLGVELDSLPTDRLVTESMIRERAKELREKLPESLVIEPEKSILIYGGGGHAKSVMDMVKSIGVYDIVGIIDDNIPAKTSIMGISVLGTRKILAELVKYGVQMAANGVGGILDIGIRIKLFELLENEGFSLPKLIHPRAMVETSAIINDGVQVFANAYVGTETILHPRCMVNTNAVVSHDCSIGAYSHIAPGALLAGHVQVGEGSLVGMGVTTAIGIRIGNNVRIGNGAIIYADVPAKTIVPAGKVWAGEGK
jgi:sugar O-acyltransferase (sialic acid O-acetyltransferase NeuD family)